MKTSAIVPTLNDVNLARTIRAIWQDQSKRPDELVIVGLFDPQLESQFPDVRFVNTQQPVCAAKARNLGMANASGDLFVFADSDCIPDEDWVAGHIKAQESGRQIVGGGINIDDPNYWA